MRMHTQVKRSMETIAANCAHVKGLCPARQAFTRVHTPRHTCIDVALRRNACARTSSDTHGCNTRKYIADVFAVRDQTEKPLRLSTQTRAFALRQSAPDAIAFAVRKRVLEAIKTYVAVDTHTLRGVSRTASLWEEEIGIFTAAQRRFLPVVTDSPHARPPVRRTHTPVITFV